MNKEDLKKKYISNLKKINKHNLLYYNKSKPKISDSEYDKLKLETLEIEKKYNFSKNLNSLSNSVGYKPSKNFEKYTHKLPMLSLSNAFNEEDLINFEKKITNYLDKKINFNYSVEPKIDGISASLTYKRNKLIYGVSRGDGKTGEVITENLKTIKDIPLEINHPTFPDEIEIRGEVFINKKDFCKSKKRCIRISKTERSSRNKKNTT
jgi:DNA ligase (NAD+)